MVIKVDYDEIKDMGNEKFINDLQKLIRENDVPSASVMIIGLPQHLMANFDYMIIEKNIEYDLELKQYVPSYWYNKKFFDKFQLVYNV